MQTTQNATTTPPVFPKALLKAVSKDKTRGHLMGVVVYPDGWAYATDGHRLHGTKVEPIDPEKRAVVPVGQQDYDYETARFPEIRHVIPAADEKRNVVVDRDALLAAIKSVEAHHKATKAERAALEMELNRAWKGPGSTVEERKRIMEQEDRINTLRPFVSLVGMRETVRVSTFDPAFAPLDVTCAWLGDHVNPLAFTTFNPKYLREAMEMFPKGCGVTLRAPEDDRSPLLITSNTVEALAVVMPVRA